MSWFDGDGEGAFGGFGDFLGDLGGFVQDAGQIAGAIGGILNPHPVAGPLPGIVPFSIGSGPSPAASTSSGSANGLILLGILGLGAYLLLKKG